VQDERQKVLDNLLDLYRSLPLNASSSMLALVNSELVKLKHKVSAASVEAPSNSYKPILSTAGEPSNKNITQQSRFVSTKNPRLAKNRLSLSKPSAADCREIQEGLCIDFQDGNDLGNTA